ENKGKKNGENKISNRNIFGNESEEANENNNENEGDNAISSDPQNEFIASIIGLKRYEARIKIIEYLKSKNLCTKIEGYSHTLPICSRSGDIVEPVIKKQWFLKCDRMARRALDAVKNGEIEIYPREASKIWNFWLENPHDWCLSRQLWWGHRIPAYRVFENGKELGWVVARSQEDAEEKAREKFIRGLKNFNEKNSKLTVEQDPDVLDTWFSSGIWPFSVFYWPDRTADLQKFFPTTLLETGSDILFFWVARMAMLALELTNQVPFRRILLHGIVRDSHGRKMSKSLGNVIDPLFVIE
ncbi:putative valine--tRNA ligase, cytoplasmic, partial [Dictyocoela roeselum]